MSIISALLQNYLMFTDKYCALSLVILMITNSGSIGNMINNNKKKFKTLLLIQGPVFQNVQPNFQYQEAQRDDQVLEEALGDWRGEELQLMRYIGVLFLI